MLANPIKGQAPVKTAAGDLVFALTFPAQKVCEARFGRRFLDIAEDLDELLLSDIGFIFWAGLQHFQPHLTEADTDVIVTETATTISFTPETLAQVSPNCRHLFDDAFIRVLVRRLHAAHEALAHPRRIL